MPPACDSRLRPNFANLQSTGDRQGNGIARVAKKLGTARLRMSERSGSLGIDCHQKCNGIISNKLGAVSRQLEIVGFSVLGRALVTFCVVALRGIRTPFFTSRGCLVCLVVESRKLRFLSRRGQSRADLIGLIATKSPCACVLHV